MFKIGNIIKCKDKEEMQNRMLDLAREGIDTDSIYEMNGEKGHWLVIVGIVRKK